MSAVTHTRALELGCGVHPTPGALHHDRIRHSSHVDVAHDLNNLPWPWQDEAFELLVALDVMEHLKLDVQAWLDEAWRILRPGGQFYMRLPAHDNPVSYRDPTHYRFFHEETFYYWQPDHALYENYGRFYFAESSRWWDVLSVERGNADPRYGVGDLYVRLRKRSSAQTQAVPTRLVAQPPGSAEVTVARPEDEHNEALEASYALLSHKRFPVQVEVGC